MCATLVFTTAISGNLASYLINSGDHEWVYDFHKGKIPCEIFLYSYHLFHGCRESSSLGCSHYYLPVRPLIRPFFVTTFLTRKPFYKTIVSNYYYHIFIHDSYSGCSSHIHICLPGTNSSLGSSSLEKKQCRIFLSRNTLCLWLFLVHLCPNISKL